MQSITHSVKEGINIGNYQTVVSAFGKSRKKTQETLGQQFSPRGPTDGRAQRHTRPAGFAAIIG